jgi:nucleotide-binding universal stress UspA family protein
MNPGPLVAAHNAAAEADDGLVLARLLARLLRRGVVVARVLPDLFEHPGTARDEQRAVRQRVEEIREQVDRLLPQGHEADIVPVLDPSVARGLHDIAEREAAALLVLGSSHHGHLGRELLGGSAELVINGSPCAVAVAPPGFRIQGRLEPAIVGVAYDGSPAADVALPMAAELATAAAVPLRVLSVLAPWWDRPIGHHVGDPEAALEAGAAKAAELGVSAERVERELLRGDPGAALADESSQLGLLVTGSRGRGGLRRALLGSVSTHVLRHARCPIVVCPAA